MADWAGRYEAVRTAWLKGEVDAGVAIVLRQGLLAWMRACPVERQPIAPPLRSAPVAAAIDVVAGRLVSALAELIEDRLQEVES